MNTQDQPNVLSPIQPFLDDPDVREIMVNGSGTVFVEDREHKLRETPSPFRDDEHVMEVIEAIITPLGRQVNESQPLTDARMLDGSRVNVIIPPISLAGPVLTIRKFNSTPLTIEDVLRFEALSEDMVEFLRAGVRGRLNIIIAGGMGAGKTAFMNLICGMIPGDERIITIENAAELQLPQKHVIPLESRPANVEGKGEISIRDLVLNALRMRPDRIIVGDVRGPESLDLLQAMNTGHGGGLMTVTANSVRDVLARLEVTATYSDLAIPLLSIRKMVAAAIDLIVYLERLPDGRRKVLKVAEVAGMQGDAVMVQDIFEFQPAGLKEGQIEGQFGPTGQIPKCLSRIKARGIELPLSLFTPG